MADFDAVPGAELIAAEAQVDAAYRRMADELSAVVDADECVLLGIMLGGLLPLARIAALLDGDYLLDYCHVSRYRGRTRGGTLEWLRAPREDLGGRTVILVDDIFDEGVTLDFVTRACLDSGAERVVSAVLVRKRHDRARVAQRPDVVGLEVDDRYVFGCGMDYQHRWRQLRAIYALPAQAG